MSETTLIGKVEQALDTIRPYLGADGGDVRVVEIRDGNHLRLEFTGNCAGCTLSSMTFKAGVEEAIRRLVPEIATVESVN